MKTPEQIENIKEYETEIANEEKSFKNAQEELENAKEWLEKQRMYYAEAIIKLHDYIKSIE